VQIYDAFDNSHGFYKKIKEEDETTSKSLLFNAFIFMQVCNEINSRKILDEYNIFQGIFTSAIFMGVLVVTIGLQVLIVMSPVNFIFKVNRLDGMILFYSDHILLLKSPWTYGTDQSPLIGALGLSPELLKLYHQKCIQLSFLCSGRRPSIKSLPDYL
jgi:magnesium-transporting ATPase (P-type)